MAGAGAVKRKHFSSLHRLDVEKGTNTDIRRNVVGQLLDFAANAVIDWPTKIIKASFEAQCHEDGKSPERELERPLGVDADLAEFWTKLETNPQAGCIRMIFVADASDVGKMDWAVFGATTKGLLWSKARIVGVKWQLTAKARVQMVARLVDSMTAVSRCVSWEIGVMRRFLLLVASGLSLSSMAFGEDVSRTDGVVSLMAFGHGGQIKMLYDRRQRPQAVCLDDKVHIVFNAGAKDGDGRKAKTRPMAVTYDPRTRTFSNIVTLGSSGSDHHYGPVIWADASDYLHVLYGCHKTPGAHMISKQPGVLGDGSGWNEAPQIAPEISYPTFHRIYDGKTLIYYRTSGHTSSWTYRISDDGGRTWAGPTEDVTDLDRKGRIDWSSYQTTLPSRDGRFLHVAFMSYDDVKTGDRDPQRFFNPRYDQLVSNEWKYNLYYVKINLETHEVTNFEGEPMDTPIDIDQADTKCRIWDTHWRGAGVPPTILLNENGDPAFLHVLSEDTLTEHRYYYVRRVGGRWKQTPITHSNHQWNSCHLTRDAAGTRHAYLIVGDGYLDTGGYMDKHGGGGVEEWTSSDGGDTWTMQRDLTPDRRVYPGWKFNNIQPVTHPDGSIVDGMLLFYGWKDEDAAQARGFLLHE